jgi:hypothetical protein
MDVQIRLCERMTAMQWRIHFIHGFMNLIRGRLSLPQDGNRLIASSMEATA